MYLYLLVLIFCGSFSNLFAAPVSDTSGTLNDPFTDCKECFKNKTFVYCPADGICSLPSDHNCSSSTINNTDFCSALIPTPTPTTISVPTSTTTESSTVPSTTTLVPSKPPVAPNGRHFDPPSFIGGIVLALGLLAIIYVSFKFYKARTERNYHTL